MITITEKRVIEILKCLIVSAASFICDLAVTHITGVASKNRLVDHGIVVQLPAGARVSFQKFLHHFPSRLY